MNEHCISHRTRRLLWSLIVSVALIAVGVFSLSPGLMAGAESQSEVAVASESDVVTSVAASEDVASVDDAPTGGTSEALADSSPALKAVSPSNGAIAEDDPAVNTSAQSLRSQSGVLQNEPPSVDYEVSLPPDPLLDRAPGSDMTIRQHGGLPRPAAGGEVGLLANPPMPGDTDFVVGMTEDRVWGVVSPGATVTVTVNGSQMGAALADGVGFFWTTLYNTSGNRPGLGDGDMVAIYEDGVLRDTVTLRSITGSIDVLNETVAGNVSGLASGSVTIYPGFAEPDLTAISQTASTDGSGDFTADLSATWNFIADERAVVAYVDGTVEVHQMLYAQRLIVQPSPFNGIIGFTTPDSPVTATVYLSDGVSVRDQYAAWTDARNGRYEFTDSSETPLTIQEDDIVVLEVEGGTVLSRTVDPHSVATWAAEDRLTGQTTPNADVVAKVNLLTALGWKRHTAETTADASGVFTIELGALGNVLPGQWAGA